jgi:ABC-type multidrug transport system fused ATPase/permease subunit
MIFSCFSPDLKEVNLVSLHQQTAIVAQDTELFQGTIRENIVYGLRESEYDDARIVEAAKAANAHDFIMCVRV